MTIRFLSVCKQPFFFFFGSSPRRPPTAGTDPCGEYTCAGGKSLAADAELLDRTLPPRKGYENGERDVHARATLPH